MVTNDEILKLLQTLTEIESLSKREEKLKQFVKEYLRDLGYNLVEGKYFISTNTKSDLIIATHLDTVPIKKPFSFDGKYAYGTGVCDAKASLTAILLSAKFGLPFTLAFFDDEEEDGLGSKEFSQSWESGKWVIVMEPTEIKVACEHSGSFELLIEVRGKSAHGAYPQRGENAIDKALDLVNQLKAKDFNFNILKIEGGNEEYIIPERCNLKLEVFLDPHETLRQKLEKLEFIKNYGTYKIEHAYEGYKSREVYKILMEALKRVNLPLVTTLMPSWTDALNLKDRFDVVVFGPGELYLCHTIEERINLEEIKKTIEVLINLKEIILS